MARYHITHICGHEEETQIYGKVAERQGRADWLASRDCAECYARKLAERRATESKQAAEQSHAEGLPALTGSDKQIAWAESIRAAQTSRLIALRDNLRNPPRALNDEETRAQAGALAAVERVLARTGAHEWIEMRDTILDSAWLCRQPEVVAAMESQQVPA